MSEWPGDTIRPASWPESRDFFVFLAGPDKSLPPESAFSQAHYEHVIEKFGEPGQLDRYRTFFLDSITQLSRQCFAWCKTQPGAVSDRSGKPDLRAAYGLLGQEMVGALTHLQHARGKNVTTFHLGADGFVDGVRPGCRLPPGALSGQPEEA